MAYDVRVDEKTSKRIQNTIIAGFVIFVLAFTFIGSTHEKVRDTIRVDQVKHLSYAIQTAIQMNNSWLNNEQEIEKMHCIDKKLLEKFNIPKDVLKANKISEDLRVKDVSAHWIHYGTKVGGCEGKYGFVYNAEKGKIGIIATLKSGETKKGNANIDLRYYRSTRNPEQFENVFDANEWNLGNSPEGNSYVEIIDINKLMK